MSEEQCRSTRTRLSTPMNALVSPADSSRTTDALAYPAVATLPSFDAPRVCAWLNAQTPATLDDLPFGVIGIDAATHVRTYNRLESQVAGLSPSRVIGKP